MKLQFAIFLLFIMSYIYSGEEETIFNPIQTYLMLYRQNIEENDLTYKHGVINLVLEGRRTNHKSLLLLGFYSIGRQLQKYSVSVREVQIIINYEMKDTHQSIYTASMESVLALSQGRINPDQFFNEVHY